MANNNVPANARTTIKTVQGTDKIQVLANGNPKRPGSLAAGRFALYKQGMTVNAYREAVKAHLAGLGKANPEGKFVDYGRADLAFDMHASRQYIAIIPAKA